MRVFGWAADASACGYYRLALPLDALAARGHRTLVSTVLPPGWLDADIIVGQRVCMPEPSQTWQRLARDGHLLVYEIDDNLFDLHPTNPGRRLFGDPAVQQRVRDNAAVASLVTVTTEALAQVMREINPNVVVLPNRIPGWLLAHNRPRRSRTTVGWAGSATHHADMAEIAAPLRQFLARHPEADLHLMGTDYSATMGLPVERIRFTPWAISVDAYLRMVDFAIGLAPLRPHIFNRSKCVDSGMRISTDRGVLQAGDLIPGMKVWRDGWRAIEAVKRDVSRPGLLVTMEGNYQLKLTPEHRMLVGDEWTRADLLKPGDRITMEAESVAPVDVQRVPWPAASRFIGKGGSRPATDPEDFLKAEEGPKLDITPRVARILGAYVGDGSVDHATKIQISCDGQDQDWIDLLMSDFLALGLRPATEKITTFSGQVLRRRRVTVSCASLLRAIEGMGLARPRPNGRPIRVVGVPEAIWRSPRDVVAEFLAGYFEADGHCAKSGVSVLSKDEKIVRDVQRLLLQFGITSTVRSRKHGCQNGYTGLYWSCTLRRAEADVFAKEIGFRSARKRQRLAEITSRPHSNAYRPMSWSRPVVSIEPCMVDPVDIQVEGGVFVLAGFVSHNSNLRVLELAALGIPVVTSEYGPYEDFVRPGETGFLVRRDHEWGTYLRELAGDRELREEMGAKARALAAEHTVEANVTVWEEAYRALLL